jgi:enoyl-CoA hydratase
VVIACSGHAIAMGLFVTLSGDYRVGTDGTYRITANEVAIGLTMPRAAIAICRGRLAPSYMHRVVALAEPFSPADAVTAGLLDEVVAPDALAARAAEIAGQLAALDRVAHVGTKARLRAGVIAELRAGMDDDAAEWAAMAQ